MICLQGEKQITYVPRGKACPNLILKNQNLLFPLPVITHKITPKSFVPFPSPNILFATCLLFLICLPATLATNMGSFASQLYQFQFPFLSRWHILNQEVQKRNILMKPVPWKLFCGLGEPSVALDLQEAWLGTVTIMAKNKISSYNTLFFCTWCVLLTACLTKYKIQNKSQQGKTDQA